MLARLLPAILCLVGFGNRTAYSKCFSGDQDWWPAAGSKVPLNTRFTLTAMGDQLKALDDLAQSKLRLRGGSDTIELRVVERLRGERLPNLDPRSARRVVDPRLEGITVFQVNALVQDVLIVVPSAPLRPATKYRLEHCDARGACKAVVTGHWKPEPVTWITENRTATPPAWLDEPLHIGTGIRKLGCGDEHYAAFDVRSTSAEVRLLMSVRGDMGTFAQSIIEVRGHVAEIGNGMCGGPLWLKPGERYEATLALVDVAGHVVHAARGQHFTGLRRPPDARRSNPVWVWNEMVAEPLRECLGKEPDGASLEELLATCRRLR